VHRDVFFVERRHEFLTEPTGKHEGARERRDRERTTTAQRARTAPIEERGVRRFAARTRKLSFS
jgi:hypothetical protein